MVELPYIDYLGGYEFVRETMGRKGGRGLPASNFNNPIVTNPYFDLYQFIPHKLAHDVHNAPAVRWKELVGPLVKWNHLNRKYFRFRPENNGFPHPFINPSATFSSDHTFRLSRASDCVPKRIELVIPFLA